eukprot:TRINITY_DN9770_c0_g2_i1.p1 TRINITY_DN9770_c0_g2~~TRINITY_DN9770_c0_g2_i1.p1  ORF type:complete len:585 (+),score=89.16 TRINITY_DN9770_c0_g2_i1:220-1974(+)
MPSLSTLPAPSSAQLIDEIRQDVIGNSIPISTPYGQRPLIYADYTASGRSLAHIESLIRQRVLPSYANTHTDASYTGRATNRLREEARAIVKACCRGVPNEHACIFTGSGSTSAIMTLVSLLKLRASSCSHRKAIPKRKHRAVVFITAMEHHSNEVIWRESLADVVVVPMTKTGLPDVAALEKRLVKYRRRPLLVGSFTAASNVTGIRTPVAELAACMHRHGGLACFDFAAAAPYVDIDMGLAESKNPLAYMDAIFISPHKFVGGPGTPGVLMVRREVVRNKVPSRPGGGTVSFVSPTQHEYIACIEEREEGGTPDIVGSIRCGLVFQLKATVGADVIHAREQRLLQRALKVWQAEPNLQLLGDQSADALTITSFLVNHPNGSRLHHNLVAALLNDLFGVQARGGCSCAGPYGHCLLNVDERQSRAFLKLVNQGYCGMKPGWCRVNLPYFLDDATADYIIDAVAMVARHGWRFVSDYAFDFQTGLWRHCSGLSEELVEAGLSLHSAFKDGVAGAVDAKPEAQDIEFDLEQVMAETTVLMKQHGQSESSADSGVESSPEPGPRPTQRPTNEIPDACRELLWFTVA